MLAKKNSKTVTIVSAEDKRSLSTGTISVTLSEKFLLMPLIYGRKTTQSLPRYQIPTKFCLSVTEKHFPNTNETAKLLNEIIVSYVIKEHQSKPT